MGCTKGEYLEIRQQTWRDGIATQAGETLLECEGFDDTPDVPGSVFDTDQNDSAGRVGEGNDCPQDPVRG